MKLFSDYDETWVEKDFGDGIERYLIRYYSEEHIERLKKTHGNNIAKFQSDAIDFVLRDWEGILGKNGQKAECNRKNKEALINTSPKRAEWLFTIAQLHRTFGEGAESIVGKLWTQQSTSRPTKAARPNTQAVANA
jgi:hypothetical protein